MSAPRRLCAARAARASLARDVGVALALASAPLAPASALAFGPAPTPVPAASPAPAAAEPAASAPATPAADLAAGERSALETVLPCGLRVLLARDLSLPVAAVVLAVEIGSEDDPPELPGLIHALTYHLYQGNRELRPGEAIAAAQDAGGVHALATGPGQVRFESLVPISRLSEVLYAESQRLRFPVIDRGRWEISLSWAASDVRPSLSRLRREQAAALHGAPGLAHDGRAVSKALAGVPLGSLAARFASTFSYARATLVVVAPEDPSALLPQVERLFQDLPPAPRVLPARAPPPTRPPLDAPAAASAPEATPAIPDPKAPPAPPPAAPEPAAADPTSRPVSFAWPVPPTPPAALWAAALCRTINRQKRESDEPRKGRLVCEYEPDPRRGALILRPIGVDDPVTFVRGRLARLPSDPGLAAQTSFIGQVLRLRVRTPLGLARLLAETPPAQALSAPTPRDLDALIGLASLAGAPPLTLTLEDALVESQPR